MNRRKRKWVFVTHRYPNTACYKRTKIGAIIHSYISHIEPGRVMLRSEWMKSLPRSYRWLET